MVVIDWIMGCLMVLAALLWLLAIAGVLVKVHARATGELNDAR